MAVNNTSFVQEIGDIYCVDRGVQKWSLTKDYYIPHTNHIKFVY